MNLPFDISIDMFRWYGEFNLDYALTKSPIVSRANERNHMELELLFDIQGNDRSSCELPYKKRVKYNFPDP